MPFLSPDLGVGLHRRAEFVKMLRGMYVRGEQCFFVCHFNKKFIK